MFRQKNSVLEIAEIDVDARDDDCEDHDGERDLHEAEEGDRASALRRHGRDDDVRARADERTVAAEACAECERPPHRREIAKPHASHILDERDKRRDERDIVDERRCDRTHPQDEHRRRVLVAVRDLDRLRREHPDDARLDERADEDEQPAEEEDRRPLDL